MRNEPKDMRSCRCDRPEERSTCHIAGTHGPSWGLEGYPVAMVYAPIQHFDRIFDLDTALYRGTIFEELDLPFTCGGKTKGGYCGG